MKYYVKVMLIKAITVACIFMTALVGLVLILDVFLLPMLAELLIDSSRRGWCGVFSRCASGMGKPFIEYLFSGAPWRRLDAVAIESRAERAAILGAIIGVGLVGLSLFESRR